MAHHVVGIDAAASGIKVTVLDTSLRGVAFQRAATLPWPEPVAPAAPLLDAPAAPAVAGEVPAAAVKESHERLLARAVGQAIDEFGLGQSEMFMGWDGQKTATRVLHFPIADMRKIEGMLDFELEDQLPRGLDDIVYAYTPVAATREKTDVLVASTEKSALKAFIEAASAAGRAPRALYAEAFCLLGLCEELGPAEAHSGVIVDIGHGKTHVLIVVGGKPLFCRTLREGGQRIDQAIMQALSVGADAARAMKEQATLGDDDASDATAQTTSAPADLATHDRTLSKAMRGALRSLVIGLKQTIRPYTAELGAAPVFITGGQSQLRGLDRFLTKELAREVRPLPLPKAIATLPDAHRYALSYAIAVTGPLSGRHPKLDLRRGELSFRGDLSGLRNSAPQWGLALAAVVLLALVSGLTRYFALRSDEAKLDDTLKQATKQMMGHEMSDFKQALAAIRQSVNPEKSVLPRFSALDYFGIVSQRIGKDVDIHASELEFRTDKILIKGDASAYDALDKIVDALKGHECFKNVNVGKSRKTSDGTRVEFNLTIDLVCGSS